MVLPNTMGAFWLIFSLTHHGRAANSQLLPSTGSPPPPPPPPRYQRTLKAYLGTTPSIDGILAPGEWDDGFAITTPFKGGVMAWVNEFKDVTDPADLSLQGWLKHDDHALYLGFNITDNLLHGIETPHWTPPANPQADALNQTVRCRLHLHILTAAALLLLLLLLLLALACRCRSSAMMTLLVVAVSWTGVALVRR
jgi:hypothetical protein